MRVLRGVKDANPRDPAIIWPNWGRGNPGLLEALEDYTAPPDPLCLNYDEYWNNKKEKQKGKTHVTQSFHLLREYFLFWERVCVQNERKICIWKYLACDYFSTVVTYKYKTSFFLLKFLWKFEKIIYLIYDLFLDSFYWKFAWQLFCLCNTSSYIQTSLLYITVK